MNEREIFDAACEFRDSDEQAAFLDRECDGNAAQKERLLELLDAQRRLGTFLESPVHAVSQTTQQAVTEKPGNQIGPYKLLEQIGEGGMGVVYLAEQREPVKRRVALKIIKPGMDSEQVLVRFEAERQALAMMDHPNIAKVLDAGSTDSDRPYFVMELVKGVPITQFCDEGRLTARQRLELFVPVCQAVQHAHQKGIIHRDIKPTNILVAMYDDCPVPKIIDFGVAKATHQQLTEKTLFTQVGQIVGTWQYMSPEQAVLNQLDVDTRSDVYSLGVVLYELLTGVTPLEAAHLRSAALEETLRLIREEDPPKPSTRVSSLGAGAPSTAACRATNATSLVRTLRGDMDWIVMRALEKSRSRRYGTASELAADVQRYLTEEPIEARPPSALYRLRKVASRHRAAVVATTAVSLMLVITAVVASWAAVQNHSLLREAREAKEKYRVTLEDYWEELTDRAIDAAFSGDLTQTRHAIEKARMAGAREDLLQTLDGLALFFDGANDDAIAVLENAVDENSDSLSALSGLWWAHRHSGDIEKMYEVEKRIRGRDIEPVADYERFFLCLIDAVTSPADGIDHVIHRLDNLLTERNRWGAAYAIRATAWREKAMESMELEDCAQAISDFNKAQTLLHSSPFALTIGLSVLTSGIELADFIGDDDRSQEWRDQADRIASELGQWPAHVRGRRMIIRYYYAIDRISQAANMENDLASTADPSPFLHAAAAIREPQSAGVDNGEKMLRADDGNAESRMWLAILLTQKSKAGQEEALEIFRELQKADITTSLKVMATDIPLLLGLPDEARIANRRLLELGLLSREWRWWQYVAQHRAGLIEDDELVRRAGPFAGGRCVAHWLVALKSLSEGDRKGAMTHFELTRETGMVGWENYHLAPAFLHRMTADPAWPSWSSHAETQ